MKRAAPINSTCPYFTRSFFSKVSHKSRIALQLRQGAAAGNRQSSFRSNVGVSGVESEKCMNCIKEKESWA